MSKITDSKPPILGVYSLGFKGKGMCAHCSWHYINPDEPTVKICGYYGSECKLVSRNCSGIKQLKSE